MARIADHAAVGDGRSAALISTDGSVDWLCWPRFDSPALFASLLDEARGGSWSIRPLGPSRARREYLADTNVLVTVFETSTGEVRLTDLMTAFSEEEKHHRPLPDHELLRVVEGTRGVVDLELHFTPHPDFGRKTIPLRSAKGLGLRLEDGAFISTLRLEGAPLQVTNGAAHARFELAAGQRVISSLVFDDEGPAVLPPLGDFALQSLELTTRWWRTFAARCPYAGPYRAHVVRSLLALKLLSYAPTGAIIAAPTTSLPERLGGELNWDYRYCWLRDASLTVRAFLDLGYLDEASAFVSWLLHTTRLTRPELRVLYDVYGLLPRDEEELTHLDGYAHSRPVRVRNAAADQLQLDTYGEVIDAVVQICRKGATLDVETQEMMRQFGDYVVRSWALPDDGIWEPRQPRRHHTHSRVLCWTALDRILELEAHGVLPRISRERYAAERQRLRDDVEAHAWNWTLGTYTQVLGGDTVDASSLLLSWYGFHDAAHPRMRSTYARLVEKLEVKPGLFWRYEESRAAGEGAFGICSFWAAEYLARGGGTPEEAERCFEDALSHANDVGLFAEMMDLESGEPLGNFPQAFTHIGLISAAIALGERKR